MLVGLAFIVTELIMLCFPFTIAYIPLWNSTDAYAARITSNYTNGALWVRGSGFVPNDKVDIYIFGSGIFNETYVVANSLGRFNATVGRNINSDVRVVAEGGDFVRSNIDTVNTMAAK
jgi:hypothetical protein